MTVPVCLSGLLFALVGCGTGDDSNGTSSGGTSSGGTSSGGTSSGGTSSGGTGGAVGGSAGASTGGTGGGGTGGGGTGGSGGTGGTPTCDQTLSPGGSVVSAVSSAPNGSTICLNTGDYGKLSFTGVARTGLVTLRSLNGVGAKMSPQLDDVDSVRFQNLTLSAMKIQNCSTNIQVVNNTWVPNTAGLVIYDNGFSCPNTNKQILVDGNSFVDTRPAWSEGKIGIVAVNGVTISNNLVQGQSVGDGGDGIQTGGSNDNLTIGPGNVFRNIRQAPCDASPGPPHCDAIQYVGSCPTCTITGNWFDDVEVVLQHHDGTVPVVFTNNLVTKAVQFWAYGAFANNSQFDHNTIYGISGFFTMGKNGSGVSTSSGVNGRSNIFLNSVQPLGCTTNCTFSHNLAPSAAKNLGTNQLTASPAFVGGTPGSITNWAGWKLASGSAGLGAGHDGKDVGASYFGP